jgi:hypothetical protein
MRPGRGARGLRAVALAHVGLVLAQRALAGRYLSGDAAGLRLHERNAELIVILLADLPQGAKRRLTRSWPATHRSAPPAKRGSCD